MGNKQQNFLLSVMSCLAQSVNNNVTFLLFLKLWNLFFSKFLNKVELEADERKMW